MLFCARNFRLTPDLLWKRACSRMRSGIQHLCSLIHRFREQARSHKDLCWSECKHKKSTPKGAFFVSRKA
ncbi:hypothetical protein FGA82_19660 [Pseudomonas fluorescens]|nr:hypothetical protein FGA82_19660 [Pseudomonas fluorescens]